jgi:hypothetical protein
LTIHVSPDGTIVLEGVCPIEDAEPLQRHLLARPGAAVDWRGCRAAHTAVVQILLAAHPRLVGPPTGDFLRTHLQPLVVPEAD